MLSSSRILRFLTSRLPSVAVLLALVFGLAPPARAVLRQTAWSMTAPNHYAFKYLRYLPPGYDTDATARWPLMIFLHGAGERGTDVERVASNGPPRLIEQGRDYPCIVVSPLCSGSGWVAAELQAFIADVVKQLRVDPNRIYLTGLSMGGYGTWDLAVRYPDYYAAIAPLCGGGDPAQAYRLRDLPVWAFHGALDATVSVTYTQHMIDAIRQAGGDPLVTIYPTLGHDVWTTTYANEDLYTWLFRQNRVHVPTLPAGITLDSAGNLYVADSAGNIIRRITPAGVSSALAGTAGTAGSTDGNGAAARFNQPGAITADRSGKLYVADTGNATIRQVTPEGVVTTFAGSASSRGSADGPPGSATFNAPGGIAVDAAGNVYVADSINATIRRITPDGVTSTYAGSAGIRGDQDGVRSAARFNAPGGLAVDASGNIYVADASSNTVRRITPDGTVTTLAGTTGVSGAADGTAQEALFNQPGGLAVDAAGSVLVADTGNSTIRKITPAGRVTTLAGLGGIAGFGDGVGSRAFFNQPRSLTVDAAGIIYVADTGNGVIRKISSGATVTTLGQAEAVAAPPAPVSIPSPAIVAPTSSLPVTAYGGGGAVSGWFLSILAALVVVRFEGIARK